MNGPVLPPRPHLFRHKRQERRKQPQHRRQRRHERAVRRRGQLGTLIAVATALDELEVVVAERPEERLRPFEHARVVVPVEVCRRIPHQPSEDVSSPRSTAAVTGPRGSARDSTNFDAFSSLIASRRPTFIWPVSNAVSVPGRPLAAQ